MTDPDIQKAVPSTDRVSLQHESLQRDSLGDASLERAVSLLRTDVPVRDAWRNALLREISESPPPELRVPSNFLPDVPGRMPVLLRAFSVQPIAAIAACVLAMVVGGVGTLAVMRRSVPVTPTTAVAAAQVPLVTAANVNSGVGTRQVIRFALVAPGAAHVSVVGDFNNWDPNATPLKTARDGSTWLIDMPLSAGRHVYAFVVDGDIVADPSAPRVVDHDFGVQNSVILVGSL
ncbi:MAG: isoamylase early set domain-containing protein [Gemmatimonas sp.]